MKGFDKLVPFYDWLAKLVFGRTIAESQTVFLPRLKYQSKILVLGGGTGWWLADLLQMCNCGEIYFIDASEKMIRAAQKRTGCDPRVIFIHGTEDSIPRGLKFDAIITFYFLDLFPPHELEIVIHKIFSSMDKRCRWLITDFVSEKRWQRIFLKTMYLFFRLTTGLRTADLPDWPKYLGGSNLMILDEKRFYHGFMRSVLILKD